MEGKNNRKGAAEGENAACELLERSGYRILERNFSTRRGEIDIIAKDGGVYVFVEVKSRSGTAFGYPEEAVTPAKQYRIAGAAASWLAARGVKNKPCRFDVVTVLDGRAELIKGAFDLTDAAKGARGTFGTRR